MSVEIITGSGSSESSISAVSWPAIIAGAVTAVATSLILLALGSGLGFAAMSPWPNTAPGAAAFTVMTGIWLIVMQWLSTGFGSYITGRLRTKWTGVHTHEVFFRDTAHGLLTWALATILVAGIAATSAASIAKTGAETAAVAVSNTDPVEALGYSSDKLFRGAASDDSALASARVEAGAILAASAASGALSADDRTYLADLVAARTGLTPAEAEQRVDAIAADQQAAADKARKAADDARKAASGAAFFTALSLLIGAFIGCVAAALGGRRRDELA